MKEIVIDIPTKLDYNALFITEFPVGLESRLHEVIRILKKDFNEFARNVVVYCGGLLLALQVLGSYLIKRTKKVWRSALSKLRIGSDGLSDHMEKDILLDVCFFFYW